MYRLFLSHSSTDNARAIALSRWLVQKGWTDHFLDLDPERGIAAGERWLRSFMQSLARCEAVLFLLSPAWCKSRYCRSEFDAAKARGKPLFGVIIEPVSLDQVRELSGDWQLCDLTAVATDAHDEIDIGPPLHPAATCVRLARAGLERLAIGLRRAGLDPNSFSWPPPGDPGRRPYPGLRALDRNDAAVFFGRDAAIVRALDRLRLMRQRGGEHLLVILGASGAGKSSFLRAGLLPRIDRDVEHFLVLPTLRPHTAVMSGDQGLIAALAQALAEAGLAVAPKDLRKRVGEQGLGADFDALAAPTPAAVREAAVREQRAPRRTIVVPVDQAEELFSPDATAAIEFNEFCRRLAGVRDRAAQSHPQDGPAFVVVMTIRSDAVPQLQGCTGLLALTPVLESLEPMPATEFKSVIDGPARRHSVERFTLSVEPALADRLVSETQGADALPMLALTLEMLYAEHETAEHRAPELHKPPAIKLTLDAYEALGGVQHVIDGAVGRAFSLPQQTPVIPAEDTALDAALRGLFALLATVDPASRKAQRLVAALDDVKRVPYGEALAARLQTQRLLVRDRRALQNRADVEVLEVAHEALMRKWKRFDAWLTEQQVRLFAVEGVRHAAGEWVHGGRVDALLVHGTARLRDAEDLRRDETLKPRFAGEVGAYLDACREKQCRLDEEGEAQQAKLDDALREREAALELQAENQRATARAQRRLQWTLASIALLVTIFAGWTVSQTRATSIQTSLVLAAASTTAIERYDFPQAVRLAALAAGIAAGPSWLYPSHPRALPALLRAVASDRLDQLLIHQATVDTADFDADGRRVVTGSRDKIARMWDAKTGQPLGAPMRHDGFVNTAQFSADGQRVVTSSDDRTARLWDANTGQPLGAQMRHEGQVLTAQFSPDGRRVVTGSTDKTARLWDAKTGQPLGALMSHEGHVLDAHFSLDGQRVVTASNDGTARLWDAETGQPLGVPMRHAQAVKTAQFSPDGQRVVTASWDRTAQLWDGKTGQPLLQPMTGLPLSAPMRHDGPVNTAQFSSDGQRVVTSSDDRTARLWDVRTGELLGVPMRHERSVLTARFSPDGQRVVTACIDGIVRIWDAKTRQPLGAPMRHETVVTTAQFGPDGHSVVTSSYDRTARIWDAKTGQARAQLLHQGQVYTAQFSPDGRRVVTGSRDTTAQVWDAKTGQPLGAPMRHDGPVNTALFSSNGQRVITSSDDWTARLWDVGTGELRVAVRHHGPVNTAQLSPDGQRIVTSSKDWTARLWDANTGQPLGALPLRHEGGVLTAQFSADGHRVVTGSGDKTARLWDARTGKPLATPMLHEGEVLTAEFSADGRRVVTASRDKTARLWDARTGQSLAAPMLHESEVLTAHFSADGRRVATGSWDAWTWDARTGQLLGLPIPHADFVGTVEFSPDGESMVTGTGYGVARVWDAHAPTTVEEALALGCRKLPGPMRLVRQVDVDLASVIEAKDVGERDVCRDVDPPDSGHAVDRTVATPTQRPGN